MKLSELSLKAKESQPDLFIASGSFEPRCASIAKTIDVTYLGKSIFLANQRNATELGPEEEVAVKCLGDECLVTRVDLESPSGIWSVVGRIFREHEGQRIWVDITTMTRELLAVVLCHAITAVRQSTDITFLYVPAEEYNPRERDIARKWLSRGCRIVQPIIGYSGIIVPGKPLVTVLLMGFELERALLTLNYLEPQKIILCSGNSNSSISAPHAEANEYFKSKLDALYSDRCTTHNIVLNDVTKAWGQLQMIVDQLGDVNVILMPMNTKISTVAALLVALDNPRIQVVYSRPEVYNTEDYATPSDNVVMFSLNDINAIQVQQSQP